MAGREGRTAGRILFGLVAQPQLDRIDPETISELVDGAFEAERADRLARCPHESVREHVHIRDFACKLEVSAAYPLRVATMTARASRCCSS